MADYDDANVFAKILRGEIPCHRVYENDDVVVFMDVMPQTEGHALVVPKSPSRNILDADPAVLSRILPIVQKVAKASMTAFEADGVSVVQYNESAGGQSVFHLHVHVIPRKVGVEPRAHGGKMEDPAILAANAAKLKAALG